ncbi:MAG: DNA topoisomerase III [Ruminococcaceae bacterium]|nr:DNA topoisomerase III [Oscillospiraceae bacterium]
MILIIAEKPSLGRNIAAAIGSIMGNMNKRQGYFENQKYIVTWAFGHLFSLADIEYYSPSDKGRWSMDNIPCFPESFHFSLKSKNGVVDEGVSKQFALIKSLANREDVDTIVNAGDADREGEIIIRICVEKAISGGNKKLMRLWMPDQTPETISASLDSLKPESEYDNLANEGFARTYIDWLYGVNLTRYATLRTGTLLRVGRVIVPVVKAIYDRDMAIRNFVKDKYYVIASKEKTKDTEVELVSKTKFKKEEYSLAQQLGKKYNEAGAVVTDVKRKKDKIQAGKLYSLSKLQNYLGKKYKMPMEESLAILQKLYESGYITYPRTNSEYLATTEKDKIKKILSNVKSLGYPVEFKEAKTIFDDSKIESHSALTPTYKIPKKENLTEREMTVYKAVFRRFVAVFCAIECLAERTEIKIKVGDYEEFVLKGMVITQDGWTKYDDYSGKDKVLPPLEKGETVNIDFKPLEKETTPPKHYTIETLNNYLKNPFREEKNSSEKSDKDDSEDYKAIFEGLELGTEATRTGIINNAIISGYIQLKKDVYTILPGGEFLIESLVLMGIEMDKYKTSQLGQALKKVFRGEMKISDSVKLAETEIANVFGKGEQNNFGLFGDVCGVCPACGKNIKRGKFGYYCEGYKEGCKLSVPFRLCGRIISISELSELLEKGKTEKLSGFISKKGKPFDAVLKLTDGKVEFDFN